MVEMPLVPEVLPQAAKPRQAKAIKVGKKRKRKVSNMNGDANDMIRTL